MYIYFLCLKFLFPEFRSFCFKIFPLLLHFPYCISQSFKRKIRIYHFFEPYSSPFLLREWISKMFFIN